MDTPPTPAHVAADEEVQLPTAPYPDDLQLNPDLEDENSPEPAIQPPNSATTDAEIPSTNIVTPSADIRFQILSFTLPFEEFHETTIRQFQSHTGLQHVTEAQQSRLVNYLDGELLEIQRRFIKNQADSDEIYPLENLLEDVARILDLVWFLVNPTTILYGQDEYFIRVTGDLEDWLNYYDFPTFDGLDANHSAALNRLFSFMQSLDSRLSFLVDGFDVNGTLQSMSGTEVVRLVPIVSRIRFMLITKLDPSRTKLMQMKALGVESAADVLNKLDVEIGRLFEGVLDRT